MPHSVQHTALFLIIKQSGFSLPLLPASAVPCVNGITDMLQFILSTTAYLHIQFFKKEKKGWAQGGLKLNVFPLQWRKCHGKSQTALISREREREREKASFKCFTSKHLCSSEGEVRAGSAKALLPGQAEVSSAPKDGLCPPPANTGCSDFPSRRSQEPSQPSQLFSSSISLSTFLSQHLRFGPVRLRPHSTPQ